MSELIPKGYKGYTGTVEQQDDGSWFGRVGLAGDVVTFESDSIEGLEHEFRESVDCYLEFCADRGEKPEEPT